MNFAQARLNMVNSQIETAGISNEDILKAFEVIPRELFVQDDLKEISYCDEELSIGEGRYILEPLVHAGMIQAVQPEHSDIVLDIGAGSGYSSAILSSLVTTVVALESEKKLLDKTSELWNQLGTCNIAALEGPLEMGAVDQAPFSLIVINGAVARIPSQIVDQLSDDGRLITIVKKPGEIMGQVTLVQKSGDGLFSSVPLFDANAHYLPGFENQQEFHF